MLDWAIIEWIKNEKRERPEERPRLELPVPEYYPPSPPPPKKEEGGRVIVIDL